MAKGQKDNQLAITNIYRKLKIEQHDRLQKIEMDLERNLPFIIISVVPSFKKIEHRGNFTNFLREQKDNMS